MPMTPLLTASPSLLPSLLLRRHAMACSFAIFCKCGDYYVRVEAKNKGISLTKALSNMLDHAANLAIMNSENIRPRYLRNLCYLATILRQSALFQSFLEEVCHPTRLLHPRDLQELYRFMVPLAEIYDAAAAFHELFGFQQ